MAGERHSRIRERAYALWVEGGHQPGADHDNWVRAEREIDAMTPASGAAETKAVRTTKAKTATGGAKAVAAGAADMPAKAPAKKGGKRKAQDPA